MKINPLRLLSVAVVAARLSAVSVVAASNEAVMPESQRAFFEKYCLSCHDAEKQKGKVRLDDIPFRMSDIQTAERWQKILGVINSGEMPPEDKKQPSAEEKASFLEVLSKQMVVARKALSDSGGLITMRRLNRREYVHTMRDLLGVEVAPKDLPADDDGGSFDTIGSGLFFSSDQFQQYLRLARGALDEAVVLGAKPVLKSGRVEIENETRKYIQIAHDRYAADKKRFDDWKSSGKGVVEFGFDDEREAETRMRLYAGHMPGLQSYLAEPATQTGVVLQPYTGVLGQHAFRIPHTVPPGRYMVRFRVAAMDPAEPRFVEIGLNRPGAGAGEMDILRCVRVTAPMDSPETVEVPLIVTKAGSRQVEIRERRHNNAEAAHALNHNRGKERSGDAYRPTVWVDFMEWEGPFAPEWPPLSHQLVFGSDPLPEKPDEADAARIITRFAERAFRGRPLKPELLESLLAHYADRRAAGESFYEAIKTPLSLILATPSFLYIAERSADKPGRAVLSDTEFANRMSYFLWSSPPDDSLLKTAREGTLRDPEALDREIDRMLADSKVARFITGFTHQWLHMVRFDFFQYNHRLFPKFDGSVKESARREVFETVALVVRENLPLRTLLKSGFVVVDDILAEYYGIPNVRGSEFRRVDVPAGTPRGGFPGMAAVLAMGSDGDRSSPVERGAWILRKLLHDAPPPAPANVPQLSRFAGKLMPARDLMKAHMEQPQCSQCHRRIDPIGFGLENFNAVGEWREQEYTEIPVLNAYARETKYFPIDASGSLPDGAVFNGFFELRDAVERHEADFARGMVEHLLEFALGRPCGFSDEDLIEQILSASKPLNYTPRAMIHALIQSKVFHRK